VDPQSPRHAFAFATAEPLPRRVANFQKSSIMQTLGLFVKHPLPGRVKTRLATTVGEEPACQLYAAFLTDLTERFRKLPVRRFLGYAPADADTAAYFHQIGKDDYHLWPQPETDLGERMFAFFADHLRHPGDCAVLIGSDSPTLPESYVTTAFQLLEHAEVVLGPAADGGYYLVGMTHPANDIFQDIAWSEPTVLQRTTERISAMSLKLAILPVWYDVDALADLQLLRGHLAAMDASGIAHGCPETSRWLQSFPG
jgi:rSAM/selenodomain-associated transferase 1